MVRPVRAKFLNHGGVSVTCFVAGEDIFPNVTELWRAAGSMPTRSPDDYLASVHGGRFVAAIAKDAGVQPSALWRRDAFGVSMTWIVAMDYAGWISPEFRAAIYKLAQDRARQLVAEFARDDDFIERREKGKVARRAWEDQVARLPTPIGWKPGRKFGHLTNIQYRKLFGASAPELKKRLGIGNNASLRDNMPKTAVTMTAYLEGMISERLAIEESPTFGQGERLVDKASEMVRETSNKIMSLPL